MARVTTNVSKLGTFVTPRAIDGLYNLVRPEKYLHGNHLYIQDSKGAVSQDLVTLLLPLSFVEQVRERGLNTLAPPTSLEALLTLELLGLLTRAT